MANLTPMTEKQSALLNKLIKTSEYLLIVNPTTISKYDAISLINFLKTGTGEYSMFTKFIRLKGPKIPNLIGDYLYEDFDI